MVAPVTMWTFTSSRAPVMPTGAPMPSWSSTTKSCGSTCRISRPAGSDTALAASMARRTSSRVISRFLPATATTPRLLNPLMWGPQTARWAESISTPAISSASSTDFLIDSTAASRLTTTPRLRPFDSATPMPMTSRLPSSEHFAHHRAHLGGADVETDDVPLASCHYCPPARPPASRDAGSAAAWSSRPGRTYIRSPNRRSTVSMADMRSLSAVATSR